MQLFEHVKSILSQNESFCKDGKIFKNNVVEAALKLSPELLAILLKDETTQKHFFTTVEGVQVFDKVKFQQFVSNKQFLPDSYTAFKNKIGLTANREYLTEANEVVLDFPYKDCVLEGGQTKEDQKRKEIFWNETLAGDEIDRLFEPKVFTNWQLYNKQEPQSIKTINAKKNNFLFKGNNLLTINSLTPIFKNQVKLIYIDPPYNTGNDGFDYNDRFNHSSWLTFMKNRLYSAKSLLSKDGTIAISIDHNELSYLLILMDEIFGKENLKNIITIKRGSVTGAKVINPGVVNISEYVVIYSLNTNHWKPKRVFRQKGRDDRYNKFIVNFEQGTKSWEFISLLDKFSEFKDIPKSKLKKQLGDAYEIELENFIIDNQEKVVRFASLDDKAISQEAYELKQKSLAAPTTIFTLEREEKRDYNIYNGELILFAKDRLTEVDGIQRFGELITDMWDDVLPNDLHNEGGVSLRKGKKPEKLIARLIELCTEENDLVFDFFVGSGTTASVALKTNRRFIVCEQLEYTETLPLNRILNTINGEQSGVSKQYSWKGGGSFVYAELAENAASYLTKIKAIEKPKEAVALWKQLKQESFISYRLSPTEFDENISTFEELELDDQKKLLIATIDKNHLYINYADMDDATYNISEEDKALNHQFYQS